MLPETLPGSDFKKEYKFFWYISSEGFSRLDYAIKYRSDDTLKLFEKTVADPVYSTYVSQLADTVAIPDDEFETETLNQGPVQYTFPKRVKMNDITVTYLDDTYESVYNFHKAWFEAIRCGKTTGIRSPSQLSATARYVTFENTMTAAEYLAFKNLMLGAETVAGQVGGNQAKSSNGFGLDTLKAMATPSQSLLDFYNKPTGGTTYPKVYPTKISRSPGNKQGNGLAKVTVTYTRIPIYEVRHSALMKYNGTSWENVESHNNSYPLPNSKLFEKLF